MKFSNSRFKFLLVVIVAFSLLSTACSNSGNQQSQHTSNASVGSTAERSEAISNNQLKDAPDFTLKNRDGEPFTLSEHEGKVVVLNIWATWCPPCRKEIPDFVDIQKEMRDKDVLFVGVSIDREGWEVVRPFAQKYEINYPIMVDDGTVNQKYGPFRGIPTTFIINKKGKVEYVAPGMVRKQKIQPILEKLASRKL